jgi:hypothetical protein
LSAAARHVSTSAGFASAGEAAKGYRTQILGLITALSTVATWAVGDATLADLVTKAPVIFGGLGLATFGVKVNEAKAGTRAAKAK